MESALVGRAGRQIGDDLAVSLGARLDIPRARSMVREREVERARGTA